MKMVAIYPGRFQPFGRHHKAAYDWLCSKFGAENCWISTSDKIDVTSPLSFDEKKSIIKKYGIENVIKSSSPYRLVDPKFDPTGTILFVLLGAKDEGRIQYFKKDGSPGYYQEYYGQKELETMDKVGYVLIAPHISIMHNGNELSGTYIRKTLSFAPGSTFSEVMGFYDPDIEKLFQTRFGGEIEAFEDMVSDLPLAVNDPIDISIPIDSIIGKTRRHICHLYEAKLTPAEIISILNGLIDGSVAAYEKFDGVNLKIGVRSGLVVCARNKADLIQPMNLYQLAQRYIGRIPQRDVFIDGFKIMSELLPNSAKQFLESENLWLNIEIVHPKLNSVYRYGPDPFVVIHGLVDSENRKVNKNKIEVDSPVIISPNRIILPKMPLYLSQMALEIRKEKNLEDIINKIGYTLLSKAIGYKAIESNISDRLQDVGRKTTLCNDPQIRQKYFDNLEKFNFAKILPFEGIVFEWGGNTYKLTGYYKYINAIMHLFDN